MSEITPNLGLSNDYIKGNITKWGVAPHQCSPFQPTSRPEVYIYLDRAKEIDGNQVAKNIRGRSIKQQPDGIYTWIYFKDLTGRERFECNRVENPSELGTKHVNLLVRAQAYLSTLLLAGELHKASGEYNINFYSGSTGMIDLGEQGRIGQEFTNKFRTLTQIPQSTPVNFSERAFPISDIPTDPDSLRHYEQLGYRLLFFQTARNCQAYRSHVLRLFSLNQNLTQYQGFLRHAETKGDTAKIQLYQQQIQQITHQLDNAPLPVATSLAELESLAGGSDIIINSLDYSN